MNVYPGSRGKPRNPTLLALAAAGLALVAVGWAVGLVPGATAGGLADARRVSSEMLSAVAVCNRLAAQAQEAAPDLAASVPSADGIRAGGSFPGSTTEGLLAGLRVENGRTQRARSAYRDCMIEHRLGG